YKRQTEGRAILLIEHNLDFIQQTGEKFYFLANQTIRHFTTFQDLAADSAVREAYPGLRLMSATP
ncbi:MAG: hypothetical protein ABL921_28575, partial [Pirellula sp.]